MWPVSDNVRDVKIEFNVLCREAGTYIHKLTSFMNRFDASTALHIIRYNIRRRRRANTMCPIHLHDESKLSN